MGQSTEELRSKRVIVVTANSNSYSSRTQTRPVEDQNSEAAVRRLKADIARTRAAMSGTIDDIQERLDPDRLKRQASDGLRRATIGRSQAMGTTLMERIRENPCPPRWSRWVWAGCLCAGLTA